MILVDETDAKRQVENNGATQGSTSVHPTSGFSYNAAPSPAPSSSPPSYAYYQAYHPPIPTTVVVSHRQSPAARFWKAFAVAVFLYLILLVTVHTGVQMSFNGVDPSRDVGYPDPSDGTIVQTLKSGDWTTYRGYPSWAPNYPLGAETSFTLPVGADALYLIAKGSRHSGSVRVKHSSDITRGSVKVDVRVAYHRDDVLAGAGVYKLKRRTNEHGIGVYSPKSHMSIQYPTDRLYFDVVLTFPPAYGEELLQIKNFQTLTNNFNYGFGGMWDTIMFDNIAITTSNGNIGAESISAHEASFETSNGHITGHYNASRSLKLRTSNGPINGSLSVLNEREQPTKLDLKTSNGPITSTITLSSDQNTGGRFNVNARTSNGPVTVVYAESPLDAVVHSDIATSNAPATVHMHSAFEGSFDVRSSLFNPTVKQHRVEDPSGRGRERAVTQRKAGNVITGTVYWAEPAGRGRTVQGSTKISTSNAAAVLRL